MYYFITIILKSTLLKPLCFGPVTTGPPNPQCSLMQKKTRLHLPLGSGYKATLEQ